MPPSGLIPAPRKLLRQPETVALWDWAEGTKIDDETEMRAEQQVVSANNVTANWEPLPGDPKNSEHCYTKVIDTADGGKAVEFGANDDAVGRPQGTAARLFFKQWGFLAQFVGKLAEIDYSIYLPDEFITKQGAGVALGIGVQNKNPDVNFGFNVKRHSASEPLIPVLWNKTGAGPVNPQNIDVPLPFKQWFDVRYRVKMMQTGGFLEIHVNGKRAFYVEGGRTILAGFGPDLYNVHAVSGLARMIFGNMRINVLS
jgi:hypothetical protein